MQEIIDSSTAYLNIQTPGINGINSGSGLIISKNDKQYVLTNAHVCLSTHLEQYISIKNNQEKDYFFGLNNILFYTIKTKNTITYESINIKDLILDSHSDVCFIPLKKKHQYEYEIQTTLYSKIVTKLTANPAKELFYKTYNRGFQESLSKISGNYLLTTNESIFMTNTSSDQREFQTERNVDTNIYSFRTIPGDSGSAIFDSNLNLKGLVFGVSIQQNAVFGLSTTIDQVIKVYNSI
jgi:V8-like Glu-specific endopeptidase